MRRTAGVLIASAAASLILSGAVVARAAGEKTGDTVRCAGINACKGQGSCAGAGNSCAGQNACKGKGNVDTSKDECMKKGGKVVESKKEK
jgi:uncharacterized membrane protein